MRADRENNVLAKYKKLIDKYVESEIETTVELISGCNKVEGGKSESLEEMVESRSSAIISQFRMKQGEAGSDSKYEKMSMHDYDLRTIGKFENHIAGSLATDFYNYSENWTHEKKNFSEKDEENKKFFTCSELCAELNRISKELLTTELRKKIISSYDNKRWHFSQLEPSHPLDFDPLSGELREEIQTGLGLNHQFNAEPLTKAFSKEIQIHPKIQANYPIYIPLLEKVIKRVLNEAVRSEGNIFTFTHALEVAVCSQLIYELMDSPKSVSNILTRKFDLDLNPMKLLISIRQNIKNEEITTSYYHPERDRFKGPKVNQYKEPSDLSYHGLSPLDYEDREVNTNQSDSKNKELLARYSWVMVHVEPLTNGMHFGDAIRLSLAGDEWLSSLYPKTLSDFMYDSTRSKVQINNETVENALILKLPKDMKANEWIVIFNQMMRACNKPVPKPITKKQSTKIYSATLIRRLGALICRQLVKEEEITKTEAIYRTTLILNVLGFKVQRSTVKKNSVDLGKEIKLAADDKLNGGGKGKAS